jgi:glycosyltransferase involved in cell wall biosynthesis
MKISYIVNVNLNDKVARAVQISANAKSFHKLIGDNFECIAIGKKNKPFKSIWVNNIKKESSILRKLLFHIQSIKYIISTDIVYSRNIIILLLAILFSKRVVWEMHDGLTGLNLRIFKLIKNKLKIVVISNALKEYLFNDFQFNKENVLVAHDGVFLDNYDELRSFSKCELRDELSLPKDKKIVMHTGSLYKGRGAELFEVIIDSFPDIYFVQVGGTVENIKEWKKYYKKFENIKFVGHQDNLDLIKYQISADLLFLPMVKESPIWWCTSPMKLFEYMATGITILTTNIGSISEVVNNENSIVFDPTDKNDIITKINSFFENENEFNNLAINALNDIKKSYSWDIRVSNINDFIRK